MPVLKNALQSRIFYEGPNVLNPSEQVIGIIQMNPAKQEKTEGMVQIWIGPEALIDLTNQAEADKSLRSSVKMMLDRGLDSACCNSCSFRSFAAGGNNKCYCNGRTLHFGLNAILRSLHRRNWPRIGIKEFEKLCSGISDIGLQCRVTAYGDALCLPMRHIKAIMQIMGTAYTNAWEFLDKKDAKFLSHYFMASVQDEEKQEMARSMGFRCFKTLEPGDMRLDKKTEFRCPGSYEMGYRAKCDNCVGCAGRRNSFSKDVVILNHNKSEVLKRVHQEKKLAMELAVI